MMNNNKKYTVDTITKHVCKFYKIPVEVIFGRSRKRCYAFPRQIIFYLSRKYTGYSYPRIGFLTKRDHATVLYGEVQVIKRMRDVIKFRNDVFLIEESLTLGEQPEYHL